MCVSRDDCSGLGVSTRTLACPSVCCVRPECAPMWCVFSVCSQGARTTTCASGHTFQRVSAECVCSCEQTCAHGCHNGVCACAHVPTWAPCTHHRAWRAPAQQPHPQNRIVIEPALGAGAGVARSAAGAVTPPSEPQCSPCPAGQSSLPLQRCGAGGRGERAGQPPAHGQQRSGGQRLPSRGGNCWAGPAGCGPSHQNHKDC